MVCRFIDYFANGILQPINADGSSVFKLGNTIPVKFTINAGNGVTYLDGVTFKISISKVGTAVSLINEADTTSTTANTDNQFRYDSLSGLYIFNLSTKTNNSSIGLLTGMASGNKYQINVFIGDMTSTGKLITSATVGIK